MLWETLKFYSNSSWVFSICLALASLVSCWQLLSLILILVKLRKSSSPTERIIRITDLEQSNQLSTSKVSYPEIIAKISGAVLVVGVMTFALGAVSMKQRGVCTSTGDISKSNDMIVEYKVKPQWWKVKSAVDGEEYNFKVCPTTPMELEPGTYIEKAFYEYRDGCDDFTSPLAKIKFK